ncbi:ParB/Srx family N-terminal domain-containing protein [Parageobacillus galactosidasius]|uniref:ParB/Sulfiredoxin domain-containing protein n=1 Tax=Parageobacillus galactosidasius TaxID=883812 RepID=A0A226QT44_9BACL|nr:ParB/Srx family N-terminal domain-containing protein [Parageobacillus galactosidasius]OXB94672.1 hypothetical protein B9L23_07330 [Parageobacillus galactosidasius]
MPFKTAIVKTLDLKLDEQNPRFVVNQQKNLTQEEIINYLLEYEDISGLAKSINNYGGLLPGERLLVIYENNNYIVLEGNRRTTAMKLLLEPSLIPNEYKNDFPIITDICRKNIEEIQVDIVDSRDEALYPLTKRHIDGIKHWKPISKLYFYKKQFDEGKSIDDLKRLTGESKKNIKEYLRKFSFLKCMIDSTGNKSITKKTIITQLETDLITGRIYNASKKHFSIPYHPDTYELDFSKVPNKKKEIFTDILRNFAHLIWFEKDENIKLTSRKINKVADFEELFIDGNETTEAIPIYKKIKEKIALFKTIQDNTDGNDELHKTNNSPKVEQIQLDLISNNRNQNEKKNEETETRKNDNVPKNNNTLNNNTPKNNIANIKPAIQNQNNDSIRKQPKPKERKFLFEGIVYSGKHKGIQRTLYEIQRLDIDKFTLSATYLMRTLLECALQEYLIHNNLFNNWNKPNYDPSLTDLINYCKQHNIFSSINKNFQRVINNAHALRDADVLNSIAHAKYNLPDPNTLRSIENRWYIFLEFLLK